jgi:hypothetical protein
LVVGLGILAYRHIVPTITLTSSTALYPGYDTAENMEYASEVVVVVSVVGKGKSKDVNDWLYTFTPLKVERVFKGDLLPGERIEFAERGGYERKVTGLYFIGREDYVHIKQNSSYLLFLIEEGDTGIYFTTGGPEGKYVWPLPQEATAENLEFTDCWGVDLDLYNSILARYGGN